MLFYIIFSIIYIPWDAVGSQPFNCPGTVYIAAGVADTRDLTVRVENLVSYIIHISTWFTSNSSYIPITS